MYVAIATTTCCCSVLLIWLLVVVVNMTMGAATSYRVARGVGQDSHFTVENHPQAGIRSDAEAGFASCMLLAT